MRHVARWAWAMVLAAALAGGCESAAPAPSHTGPGRVYDQKNGFSLLPPEGWNKRQTTGEIFLQYTRPEFQDGMATLLIVTASRTGNTKIASSLAELRQGIAEDYAEVAAIEDGWVTIGGKRCARIALQGTTSSGVRHQLVEYIIPSNNRNMYVLCFICAPSAYAANRPVFDKCAESAVTD